MYFIQLHCSVLILVLTVGCFVPLVLSANDGRKHTYLDPDFIGNVSRVSLLIMILFWA